MRKKYLYTVGFDLGGTKLASALVRNDGLILKLLKTPVEMGGDRSPATTQKRIIQMMVDQVLQYQREFPEQLLPSRFQGVGLASAGPLNVETGTLISPANFPGWGNVPIQSLLKKALSKAGIQVDVAFQNDAMAAALAEGWLGHAKGLQSFAVVTVGTGIGTGVILNGQPCQSQGSGSEFGHTIIDLQGLRRNPHRLRFSTVEGMASGTGLLESARRSGFKGQSVEELVEGNRKHHKLLFENMSWALAMLCFNLSVGFHLEGIYFSGGLIKIKDLYFEKTKAHYKNLINQFNPLFRCPVAIAKTRNHAPVLGAAFLPYISK